MFFECTPEYKQELNEAIEKLKGPVKDLNNKLPEFSRLVHIGFVKFSAEDLHLQSMPQEYRTDYLEWLNNGAVEDFILKMTRPYKHFDADSHEEHGGDPEKYVRTKSRKVILGGLGSIWIDLPLTGVVKGEPVTKWTRAAFQFRGFWIVHFDPTEDSCSFGDMEESARFIKLMTTGGVEIDLDA